MKKFITYLVIRDRVQQIEFKSNKVNKIKIRGGLNLTNKQNKRELFTKCFKYDLNCACLGHQPAGRYRFILISYDLDFTSS